MTQADATATAADKPSAGSRMNFSFGRQVRGGKTASAGAGNLLAAQAAVTPAEAAQAQQELAALAPVATSPTSRSWVGRSAGAAAPKPQEPPTEVRHAPTATPSPAWRGIAGEGSRFDVVTVRRAMAASKVLTPIIVAMSLRQQAAANAGAPLDPSARAQELKNCLLRVHSIAERGAEAVSTALRADVPSWTVTRLMEQLATSISQRGDGDMLGAADAIGDSMSRLFEDHSDEVGRLISDASDDAYAEVDGVDVVRNRVAVSALSGAWRLHDWLRHRALCIDPPEDLQRNFYSFERDIPGIVQKLLASAVSEATALMAQVDSADLRTAHLQASIGRLCDLMGGEYVAATKERMRWMAEASSDEEFAQRSRQAAEEFETKTLPAVIEAARTSFLQIEVGASKQIEALNEKNPFKQMVGHSPVGGGDRSRSTNHQ